MARRYRPNSWLWVYCGKNSCTTSQTSLMCLIPFWLGFGISTFMHYRNKEENFNLLVFCWSSPCHLSKKQPAYSLPLSVKPSFSWDLSSLMRCQWSLPLVITTMLWKKNDTLTNLWNHLLNNIKGLKMVLPSSSERIDFLAERVTFEA